MCCDCAGVLSFPRIRLCRPHYHNAAKHVPEKAYVLSWWCVRRHKEDESRRDEDAVSLQARQSASREPEPPNTSQAELLTPIQHSENLTQMYTLTGSTPPPHTHTHGEFQRPGTGCLLTLFSPKRSLYPLSLLPLPHI